MVGIILAKHSNEYLPNEDYKEAIFSALNRFKSDLIIREGGTGISRLIYNDGTGYELQLCEDGNLNENKHLGIIWAKENRIDSLSSDLSERDREGILKRSEGKIFRTEKECDNFYFPIKEKRICESIIISIVEGKRKIVLFVGSSHEIAICNLLKSKKIDYKILLKIDK